MGMTVEMIPGKVGGATGGVVGATGEVGGATGGVDGASYWGGGWS